MYLVLENHCLKRLKIILQSRYLFKIICIVSIIYSLIVIFYVPIQSKYSLKDKEILGQVIDYQFDGNKIKITLKGREKIIANYYFKTEKEKQKYEKKIKLGIILKINGELVVPKKNTIPNGFNYNTYLKYHNINYYMSATDIEIIENNTSLFYYIKNILIERIDKIDNTGYLRTFILGDKTILDEETTSYYQQNGISHLFSISGMHVSLIAGMIMYFLNKVSYSNYYKYGTVIPLLIFYMFLTGVGASILRTVIMYIVFAINKCFNLNIKKIDLMLIVLIIAIIINPFIVCDIGFQYSYSISFTLILFNKKISNIKNKIYQNLFTSLICFLISFPICIYYYSEVNFLSIIFNLFMIPIVSIIIFPLTLLTMVVPIIYPLYKVLIVMLEEINIFLATIDIFKIVLFKPSIILIIIYYFVIILAIYNIKYLLLFVICLIIHQNYLYFDDSLLIATLDVGQGDSIFIKLPNNKENILIDTGGKINLEKETWKKSKKEFSIAEKSIIPYLKSLGINKLKYLIITHGDFDHMGEAINLVENFKVENVIFNCGQYDDLEKDLIKVLDIKKIPYYSCIKKLNINDNKLYFLNNKDYGNENDNSSVIYTELNNYKFLFMGDAGVEVERDLIEKYNLKDIDVLKVGHHGSKTSSSKDFIDKINPEYSIISVGKNNRYGHPNKEVLDNLNESKIYRTDEDGSIMFKIKNNKLKIETCEP